MLLREIFISWVSEIAFLAVIHSSVRVRVEGTSLVEKGIQIALRYLENKLTRLINRGVLIKLTQSQNNYSNLHFYCSTLVFNIYFFEFAKLLGGPGPPRPLPTLRHCPLGPSCKYRNCQYNKVCWNNEEKRKFLSGITQNVMLFFRLVGIN